MGHTNMYWTVAREASITRPQISADWAAGDYSQTKIECLNFAFHLFYDAKTSILECRNPTERSEMFHALNRCGQQGWGLGVHDMEDAFEHLIDHGGSWTDNNTANYQAALQRQFGGTDDSINDKLWIEKD